MSDYTFQIVGDASRANRAIADVERGLGRLPSAASKAEQAISGVGKMLHKGLAVAGIGLAGRELLQIADGYTNIQNRLRLLAGDQANANRLFDELRGIASRTRQDLTATVDAYQGMSRATKALGMSQSDTLKATETLNKLVTISGKSAQESAAGLMQFSQALSSGRLQGDELRSVFENMPTLVDALMSSLGKTQAELRQMGSEGKITSKIMVDALLSAGRTADEQLGKTIPTISQSITELKNNLMVNLGPTLQSATQLLMRMGDAIGSVNENLGGMKLGLGTVAGFMLGGPFGAAVGTAIESANGLAEKYGKVTDEMQRMMDEHQRLVDGIIVGTISEREAMQMGFKFADVVELKRKGAREYREALERTVDSTRDLNDELRDFTTGKNSGAVLMIDALVEINRQLNMLVGNAQKIANALTGSIGGSIADAVAKDRGFRGIAGAFSDKGKSASSAKHEVDAYADVVERATAAEREAYETLNLLGQAYMNGAITLRQYNEQAERHRNLLIDIDALQVKSQTSMTVAPISGVSDLALPDSGAGPDWDAMRENLRVAQQGVDEINAALQRIETERLQRQFESLGRTLRPIADTLIDMFKQGEFSAKRLESVLKDVAIQMLRMAAIQALSGSTGGGASLLRGLLGGGRNGFDYVSNSQPLQLPGFRTGGDAMIGGRGGPDTTLVAFWGTPGESYHVRTPQQRREAQAEYESLRAAASSGGRTTVVVQTMSDPREISRALGSHSAKRELVKLNRQFDRRR